MYEQKPSSLNDLTMKKSYYKINYNKCKFNFRNIRIKCKSNILYLCTYFEKTDFLTSIFASNIFKLLMCLFLKLISCKLLDNIIVLKMCYKVMIFINFLPLMVFDVFGVYVTTRIF